MGMGMPATSLLPSSVNSLLRFDTGLPPLITSARPRAAVIMPSVTMNGATRPLVMTQPLTAPQPAPASTPRSTGTASGYCCGWAKQAATTPVSATSEPSDRSTPPVSSTKVTPTARMPLMEICRTRLTRFGTVRKIGLATYNAAQIATSAMTRPNCPCRDFNAVERIALPSPQLGMAYFMTSSCVVSSGRSSAVISPSRMTRIRSLRDRISAISDDTMMMALPSRASRRMIA